MQIEFYEYNLNLSLREVHFYCHDVQLLVHPIDGITNI